MKKRQPAVEGGSNWMDTYGDMVTLLLCFFVLLYSISSTDQQKWEILVRALNPEAFEVSQIVVDHTTQEGQYDLGSEPIDDEITDEFDDLYYTLKKVVEEAGLSQEQVQITKGAGFPFITFREYLFFDGNSSVLREDGKVMLRKFAAAVGKANNSIKELRVLGHTSQGDPTRPNNPEVDWVLSSERAGRVTAFLQMNSTIEPNKMTSTGYGQFRPIAPFDTTENRAKNRRVEIIITKSDAVEQSLDEYYTEVYGITVAE